MCRKQHVQRPEGQRGYTNFTSLGKQSVTGTLQAYLIVLLFTLLNFIDAVFFFLIEGKPWPAWLSWLGVIPQRNRLPVQFPIRAHTWAVG